MSEERIRVEVRLFAALREAAGVDRVAVTLPVGATAGDAWDAVWAARGVAAPAETDQVALAVNREYAATATRLADGDEVALIPPVSGGAPVVDPDPDRHVAVRAEPLDQAGLYARVARPAAGAIVTFAGTPRDVPQLDYEAHERMAEERMAAIVAEVAAAHGVCAIAAEHRVGAVPWPEAAVVVAVSAPHRGEAFAAARQALDRIKAEAPIWKQEVAGEQRTWVAGTLPTAEPVAPAEPALDDAAAAALHADAPAPREPLGLLPHLREDGGATMVDVGEKQVTARRAVAAALVTMSPETAELVRRGDLPKGDVLGTARLAGTMAAKRVPDLVPLAHPLPLTKVDVQARVVPAAGQVRIEAEARTVGRTGVEIEAMTAALIAAVNVYDMVKGVERGVAVGPVTLVHKSGGRSGDFDGPAPWGPEEAPATGPAAGPRDAPRPLDPPVRAALLTVSSSRADGPADDPGSVALRELAAALGVQVAVAERVADDREAIAARLVAFADELAVDLVLTAGGTGMTVDDVTPEATLQACERIAPGIAEALRLASREHTHAWPLSRAVAAVRGRTLVVNLPGTPKAAAEARPVLEPILTHAIRLLRR
ncbi:cyclic pyranopterin monophosphate synthase MoaC [Patulibacter defluvii]|uniref:cyclic pyranopterin monophosphate synthase MoaC n=2 Tax=Bacteria TaxID=2 RepID=UPI002A74BF97|nr:cyclic pyranopterin monophosphate synthase MoaC [Patulibacter sp. DM4]